MKPTKEKAVSLVKKFWMKNKNGQDSYVCAVDCAKIAVELILNDVGAKDWENEEGTNYNYWQEVLNELNKL